MITGSILNTGSFLSRLFGQKAHKISDFADVLFLVHMPSRCPGRCQALIK